jgi:AraC family transcriptional regulator
MKSNITITDIAYRCGFTSPATFSRAFKQYANMSASEYRKAATNKKLPHNSKICKVDSKDWEAFNLQIHYLDSSGGDESRNKNRRMDVEVKFIDMPKYHVAYVANLEGYIEDKIAAAWQILWQWAFPRGLINQQALFIGLSMDDPDITPKHKCRYLACITVPETLNTDEKVNFMDIPGGKHAVGRFEGYGNELEIAYKVLYGKWLPDSGCQPADSPPYEIYYSTPQNHPEGKFIVDLCIPIKSL